MKIIYDVTVTNDTVTVEQSIEKNGKTSGHRTIAAHRSARSDSVILFPAPVVISPAGSASDSSDVTFSDVGPDSGGDESAIFP